MLDTSRPASRILAVLELLQNRPGITGPQLAEELEVSSRTVRRYITTLQDMGVPVETTTGRFGGYSLLPGFRLPPMMFSDDEALGLAMALLATRHTREMELTPGVQSALTKIERILPPDLVGRMNALREGISYPEIPELGQASFPDPTLLARLAQACLATNRIWMRYSRPNGEESARTVDPYGIGALFGRWYLHGWCHLRNERRTFRIDRIRRIDVLEETFEPPDDIDVMDAIERSLALAWSGWNIRLEVAAPAEDVSTFLPRHFAIVEPIDEDRCLVSAASSDLEWFAWRLARLPYPMHVLEPPELRDAFRQHADRLAAIAGGEDLPNR
ncbi:MAG TPA: YafY family protein [Thermomicrobiales bacterium]|nr:YafY family protein [Thermomicrobiales bacterium]